MARVLEHSARKHCPGWDVDVARLEPSPLGTNHRHRAYHDNTHKLDHWTEVVLAAPHWTALALMDVDTVVLRDLGPVWDTRFDIAITMRDGDRTNKPINAGVVFLRVTPRVQEFFMAWRDENRKMLESEAHHRRWRSKYGGINQAALGCLLEAKLPERLGLEVAPLACSEWNCEDSTWGQFDSGTRVVHLKSALRLSVFGLGPVRAGLRPLVSAWRSLERAANGGSA